MDWLIDFRVKGKYLTLIHYIPFT